MNAPTTTEEPALRVLALTAENVKRLRAVSIRPDSGSLVVIGGANAQGKSSVIDSIEMALGGGKALPQDPIRHGARRAKISVDLGEVLVERTFSAKGSKLVVTAADGTPCDSPQRLLDSLTNKVTFDPLAFTRMKPAEQDKVLKQVLGLDFAELEGERARLFAARTDAKREAAKLEARVDAIPDVDAPNEEVSLADLLAQVDAAEMERRRNDDARTTLRELEVERGTSLAVLGTIEEELAELETRRARIVADLAERDEQLKNRTAAVESLVDPDTEALRGQVARLEETNRKVRKQRERRTLSAELDELEASVTRASDAIADIDAGKAARLADAEFPVDGLGFDDVGPTLNGVPLEQASQAEKLRVSVAIGVALNPRVRVLLVREGSNLDSTSLQLLAELAEAHGAQVWLERVSETGEGCSVVIEDGMVREGPAEIDTTTEKNC